MNQDKLERSMALHRDVLDIHFGRAEFIALMTKKESDSYSILCRKIQDFVNGKKEKGVDIYGDKLE